uniref:Uncharacterized protein n=1 Tax=Eutreptiella gymnastica TaxID=73025 RepID=A0A7S4GGF2_9EUGL
MPWRRRDGVPSNRRRRDLHAPGPVMVALSLRRPETQCPARGPNATGDNDDAGGLKAIGCCWWFLAGRRDIAGRQLEGARDLRHRENRKGRRSGQASTTQQRFVTG